MCTLEELLHISSFDAGLKFSLCGNFLELKQKDLCGDL